MRSVPTCGHHDQCRTGLARVPGPCAYSRQPTTPILIVARFGGDAFAYAAALAPANADLATARHIIGEQLRRRAIARTLPGRGFRSWSLRQQRRALARTVCVHDDPPPVGIIDLTRWLPFLKLP